MTTAFRKAISRRVLLPLKDFIRADHEVLLKKIPLSLRLCDTKFGENPKFELYWKDLLKLKPDLDQYIHPITLGTHLINQGFGKYEGILEADMEKTPQIKYSFSISRPKFHKFVLESFALYAAESMRDSSFCNNIFPLTVIIEFSSPNIAKPFHFGHFRSTIVGNFLANIFRYVGHKVISINYIGDWGLQYGILATGFNTLGSKEELNKNPMNHLHWVYKEANLKNSEDPTFHEEAKKYFQEMEKGDPKFLEQWEFFRKLSLENMKKTYERLGVQFDVIQGESSYAHKAETIFEELLEKNIAFQESDGSLQAAVSGNTNANVVLKKSDGTTLYLSRDIAAAIDRHENFHFDSMYYVVDSSQSMHFTSLFSLLDDMGYTWSKDLYHVPFGRILNFSSRKGNAVFLDDVLNEAQERTLEKIRESPTTKITDNWEKTADILGISCLIINDLSKRRAKNYNFNWENVLSMTADSGYTLQYCHARLYSLQKNCGVKLHETDEYNYDLLREVEAHELIEQIARFDEAIYDAYTELESHILVHYLFELKRRINRANKVLTVKGEALEIAKVRLFMFQTAYLVLKRGLKLLGIQPLKEM